MSKKIAVSLVIVCLSLTLGFFIGRSKVFREQCKPEAGLTGVQKELTEPVVFCLPDARFVATPNSPAMGGISVTRSDDRKRIIRAGIFSGTNGACEVIFYEQSGRVMRLSVCEGNRNVHKWSFGEDGRMTGETIFSPDGSEGISKMFNSAGDCIQTNKVVVHME